MYTPAAKAVDAYNLEKRLNEIHRLEGINAKLLEALEDIIERTTRAINYSKEAHEWADLLGLAIREAHHSRDAAREAIKQAKGE